MAKAIENLYGKTVTLTLRHWLSPPIKGVLVECDSGFVVLDSVKKGRLLVPAGSILHIRLVP